MRKQVFKRDFFLILIKYTQYKKFRASTENAHKVGPVILNVFGGGRQPAILLIG
jgi:hypothetical protein